MSDSERILDRLRDNIRNIFSNQITEDNLNDKQQNLSIQFIEGLADGLGIPTDNLTTQKLTEWILHFVRAFIKPEYLDQTISPSDIQLRTSGKQLGQMIKEAVFLSEVQEETNDSKASIEEFLEEKEKIKSRGIYVDRH